MRDLSVLKGLVPLRVNGAINHKAVDSALLKSAFLEIYPECHDFSVQQMAWHVKNHDHPVVNSCKCGRSLPFTGKGYRSKCAACKSVTPNEPKIDGRTTQQAVERRKATCLAKFGTEYATQSQEVKDRSRLTNELKYGARTWNSTEDGRTQASLTASVVKRKLNPNLAVFESMSDNELETAYRDLGNNFQLLAQHLNVSTNTISRAFRDRGLTVIYPHSSAFELQVANFIETVFEGEIIQNSRTILPNRLELDIFIPSKNFAIEANGIYWHSYDRPESTSEKNRHLKKREECKKLGIDLLQITDIEWTNQQDLVKSMIMSRLGVCKNRIFARHCVVRAIDVVTARDFLDANHIQGFCGANTHLGLFKHDELVAVMSFSQPRFTSKFDWELIRFAVKQQIHVVGGASRLLAHFRRVHVGQTLISYSNNMKFAGGLYATLGFTFSHSNGPGYHYTDLVKMFSRVAFQKHKLQRLFGENYDSSKTESENCFANGLYRYWDCGTDVWTLIM